MNWSVVLDVGVVYGGIFVLLFGLILFVGQLAAPDVMVQDYPPAIRERYGLKSARGERVGRVMGALMLVLLVGVTTAGVTALRQGVGGDIGFWPAFVFGAGLIVALHVFDLVVIDWILFCGLRPRFLVLPGTEDMPEYGDWRFHLRVLIPRPVPWPLLMIPAYGGVVGVLTVVAEALVG